MEVYVPLAVVILVDETVDERLFRPFRHHGRLDVPFMRRRRDPQSLLQLSPHHQILQTEAPGLKERSHRTKFSVVLLPIIWAHYSSFYRTEWVVDKFARNSILRDNITSVQILVTCVNTPSYFAPTSSTV